MVRTIFSIVILAISFAFTACKEQGTSSDTVEEVENQVIPVPEEPFLTVLGTVQDAGSPHMGCKKECCADLFDHPNPERKVVSLAVVDPLAEVTALFEATPDIVTQDEKLRELAPFDSLGTRRTIFLTHAHIGHYSGLMYLGKESMNTRNVKVRAMPRMKSYLENNGPWDQLEKNKNINLYDLTDGESVVISKKLFVTPFLVPHRDEYSETVGYLIQSLNKKVLFIPDIDKWEKWDRSIVEFIAEVDYAYLDATFFDAAEVNHRDISEIPHPFVIESMELFKDLPASEKQKVHFIHFNHTNPLLDPTSPQYKTVIDAGFNIATFNDIIQL